MKNLLFINVCIRQEQSRTYRIAAPVIHALRLKYKIETIDLTTFEWDCINSEQFHNRNLGIFQKDVLKYAEMTAQADRIIIAAPFWDMSFPAILKVFFEQISLPGYTFEDGPDCCIGKCRCEKLLYITTRGMNIKTGDKREQAVPYLEALSQLWNLGEIYCIACENMDYVSENEREQKIQQTITSALKLCEEF